jgi:predicted DNA-binding transcriptional regulator YafY
MPINKQALIRYKTIDNCLRNRFRKWTLEDLMEACSDALYEFEGITKGISRRSIQMDLQNMRSEKLGYNAPIIVTDKKFYSYEDKGYSINNTPINEQDLQTLNEVLDVLKQFKGFGYFQELNSMVTRLEDKLLTQTNKSQSFIDFEKNDLLKGLQYIDPLHRAICNKLPLEITYQSFKQRHPSKIEFHPYLLKEYRNRWFLLGWNQTNHDLIILALDRMEQIKELPKVKYRKADFNVHTYFNDTIGVTKSPSSRPIEVVVKTNRANAPYIITKPLHHSQKVLKRNEDGSIIFSINVIHNFELEREILGFGENIEIISPRKLKGIIRKRLHIANEMYLKLDAEQN